MYRMMGLSGQVGAGGLALYGLAHPQQNEEYVQQYVSSRPGHAFRTGLGWPATQAVQSAFNPLTARILGGNYQPAPGAPSS